MPFWMNHMKVINANSTAAPISAKLNLMPL
ncbi:hypothetical protein GALL_490050 [mine drainage metagenome]|uniref:Uncharacterized protein n=1 Tax=mine drainage metagenome TaxID=410659 RepID=A0A1J5PP90_9ZZZZ